MKIQWLDQALNDLDRIYNYYTDYSERTAYLIVSVISKDVLILKDQPQAGQVHPSPDGNLRIYRTLVTYKGLFKILYYAENDTVYIYALINCRQDPNILTKVLRQK